MVVFNEPKSKRNKELGGKKDFQCFWKKTPWRLVILPEKTSSFVPMTISENIAKKGGVNKLIYFANLIPCKLISRQNFSFQ